MKDKPRPYQERGGKAAHYQGTQAPSFRARRPPCHEAMRARWDAITVGQEPCAPPGPSKRVTDRAE